jgi:hypothetical protein
MPTAGEVLYGQLVSELTRPRALGVKGLRADKVTEAAEQLLGSKYSGTFAADMVKLSATRPWAICNTDPVNKPGEHWVGLCRLRDGSVLCYDSYGRSGRKIISGGLPNIHRLIDTDRDKEQSETGWDRETCGHRCLAWLMVCKRLGPNEAATV